MEQSRGEEVCDGKVVFCCVFLSNLSTVRGASSVDQVITGSKERMLGVAATIKLNER